MSKLSSNDLLMLAGSFHGYILYCSRSMSSTHTLRMHAITKQLCPIPAHPTNPVSTTPALAPSPFSNRPSGLEVLETSQFRMQCFQTLTGTKFLLFTEPQQPNIESMIRKIYELYADFVMKNPFYTVEMPIRCEKFDRGLDGFVKVRS
jgi:hypothetical protein